MRQVLPGEIPLPPPQLQEVSRNFFLLGSSFTTKDMTSVIESHKAGAPTFSWLTTVFWKNGAAKEGFTSPMRFLGMW